MGGILSDQEAGESGVQFSLSISSCFKLPTRVLTNGFTEQYIHKNTPAKAVVSAFSQISELAVWMVA